MKRFADFVILAAFAILLFAAMDILFSWNPLAAAPYQAWRHDPVFRARPWLGLGMRAEAVNGLLATLSFLAIETGLPQPLMRRTAVFGLILWAFWTVSGSLTALVWFAIPVQVAASNIAWGLPKCLAIAGGLTWLRASRAIRGHA